jgi:chromosome partitioning protein
MKLKGASDYLLIDTPARPDSDDMKELSKGCDFMVLPTAPDVLNLQPLLMTAQEIDNATYRVLLTMAPPLPNRDAETMQQELREGDIPVFNSPIRRTIGFAKAALAGTSIRDLSEKRFLDAWNDYESVGNELLELLK